MFNHRGAIAVTVLLLGLFVVQASALARGGQAAGAVPLTNDDIVKMVQAKLPDAVIVAKIKSSACKFDNSTDALIKLQQIGVSGAVLAAMAEGGAANTPGTGDPPPDPNDPDTPHDPGIYYVRQNPGGRRMSLLEPSVYSGGKTSGVVTMAMTHGISHAKWKAVVRGNMAALRVTEARPTYYFYFEQKSGTLSYSGSRGGGASSPNEFILAHMEKKSDERELVMGQMNAFGAQTGTRSKDTVPFDFEKVKPGIYKVQPRSDVEPGEYCFYYGGSAQAVGTTGGKVFDFGINPGE